MSPIRVDDREMLISYSLAPRELAVSASGAESHAMVMTVLFLDFDGVLHPEFCHATRHFECEAFFAAAICGLDLEIVVSSTWRHDRDVQEIKVLLSDSVSSRVVGKTPSYSKLPDVPSKLALYEREAECVAWLASNRPAYTQWLAVDDRPWLFRPFSPHLFLVDGKRGLHEQSAQLLRARLNELSQ